MRIERRDTLLPEEERLPLYLSGRRHDLARATSEGKILVIGSISSLSIRHPQIIQPKTLSPDHRSISKPPSSAADPGEAALRKPSASPPQVADLPQNLAEASAGCLTKRP